MKNDTNNSTTFLSRWMRFLGAMLTLALMVPAAAFSQHGQWANPAKPNLGTAGNFAVLAGSAVTVNSNCTISGNVGCITMTNNATINGNVEVTTNSVPGIVTGTTTIPVGATYNTAESDLVTGYNAAYNLATIDSTVGGDLTGATLFRGKYGNASSIIITGTLTLSGDANDVFIFEMGSTLGGAVTTHINLIGGAVWSNVFWLVNSDATIDGDFKGNILAKNSITQNFSGGSTLAGRALTQIAFVTVSGNSVAPTGAIPLVDTLGARAKLVVKLANKAVQDSVIMPTFKIAVFDTLTTTSDSVAISFAAGKFLFAKRGPYPVVVNGAIVADSARVNTAGTSLFIKITGPVGFGDQDTLTISGVYVKGIGAIGAFSDSTTHDSLSYTIGDAGAGLTAGLHKGSVLCVLLPAPIYTAVIGVQPTTPVAAGSSITSTLSFTDQFGNVPNDSATAISVAAVLNGTSTPGNGTLSGLTTITHTVTLGHPGVDTYQWTALKYTKAELIQLKFTALGGAVTSNLVTVTAGAAANISLALLSGKSDTLTVEQTTGYEITVTDQFYNPINNQVVTAAENTSHGGSFAAITNTDVNGQTSATFSPGNFFVGADTLKFTASSANQLRAIVINAGALGGIIVDYAGTASGSSVTTENIAAGTTVYARGFLRDSYGNPINAASASAVTFTINGTLGKGTALGTSALTTSITQPLYPNTNKTAVGVAIPYTVSTNVRATADSVLATASGYSLTITIQNRSDVPASVKIVQSLGGGNDSSLVASATYVNSTILTDTVWDQYKNLVTAPGTVTIAPLKAAYKMYFTTTGKVKFNRGADTTVADTLYPTNGNVSETVIAGKVSGTETVTTSAVTASVTASVPMWVTPAAYAKLAITPHVDTTAIAGKADTFTIEKLDTYGNHIDIGLAGNNARGNAPSTTKPSAANITADSSIIVADTVTTGHNRGGHVTKTYTMTGTAGVASVGGTLKATFPYVPYAITADTQKIYARLSGFADTVLVRSIQTGVLGNFTVTIAAGDSVHNAGDSVNVTITAFDALLNRVYSYNGTGQTVTLNNTTVTPNTSKDTTFYFSYTTTGPIPKYVKRSSGVALTDTIFAQGLATITLRKFKAEATVNTVTVTAGAITATSVNGSKFMAKSPVGQTTWSVTAGDTVGVNAPFSYTIAPRDTFYNINYTVSNFATVSSNQGVNFDAGSNPKIFTGPVTYAATQNAATTNLIIYVSNGTGIIFGQSKSIVATAAVIVPPGIPVLQTPANSSVNQELTLTLTWGTVTGAATYRLQVATDSLFATLVVNDSTLTSANRPVSSLLSNTKYYWRVNAKNGGGTSSYSSIFNFRTKLGTGVEENKPPVPTEFFMAQNYPNPFNPTTNINFGVPQNSSVKIAIYDMLGREVATLVNTNYTPGYYTVPFNASKLASGMYMYRMTSQSLTGDQKLVAITKKLLLVK